MAIFVNHKKNIFVLTSYKVGYSSLLSQEGSGLNYLHYIIDFPIIKHLTKHFNYKRYVIVRNPYYRFLSLFSDKYRKQPQRILDGLHSWENVHICLFPHLNIKQSDSDKTIASKFFEMSISDFIKLIPLVISNDEHFMPQTATKQFRLFDRFPINLRINGFFRIEDQQAELTKLTGIDFGVKKNTSNSKQLKNKLSEKDLILLNKLYKNDFLLGNYKIVS
jgi:hypothetical protein